MAIIMMMMIMIITQKNDDDDDDYHQRFFFLFKKMKKNWTSTITSTAKICIHTHTDRSIDCFNFLHYFLLVDIIVFFCPKQKLNSNVIGDDDIHIWMFYLWIFFVFVFLFFLINLTPTPRHIDINIFWQRKLQIFYHFFKRKVKKFI